MCRFTLRTVLCAFALLSLASRAATAPIAESTEPIELSPAPVKVESPAPGHPASDGTLWTADARLQSPDGKLARQAFEAGRLAVCLSHLRAVVDQNPSLPPPHVLLAQIYLSQNRPAMAAGLLEEAAWRHKEHPEVFLVCGEFELHQGRLANAWVHFQRAMSLKTPPSWPPEQQARLQLACHQNLAMIAERRGDWHAASVTLGKLDSLQPGNAGVLGRWGNALFLSGSSAEALEKFGAAYRASAEQKPPELSMAALCVKQGDFAHAETWFEKAIEKYPDNGLVHFERAAALLRAGQTQRALAAAKQAEQSQLPDERLQVELKMIRGIIAAGDREYEAAEREFVEVLRQSPGHEQALRRLPLVMVEQQSESKRRQALNIAKINAKKHPQSTPALATLAWVQFRLDETDGLQQTLELSVSPSDPESTYLLAKVMVEAGQIERATPFIRSLAIALEHPGWFPQRSEAQDWVNPIVLTLD